MKLNVTEADILDGLKARLHQDREEASMAIGDWADRHLLIPSGSGPVPHDQRVTPYWREPLGLIHDRIHGTGGPGARVERITIVCATQVGKTWGVLVPTLAWLVATHPRKCAVILHSDDAIKRFAGDKLEKAFRLSPRLKDLLPAGLSAQEKRMGTRGWQLDRCTIPFLNGSVAAHLRGDDVPLVLGDEFDLWPANLKSAKSHKSEGSPLGLIRDRQKTFPHDRLRVLVTSPTYVDAHGWAELCAGTHERLLIACPSCGAHHVLGRAHLRPVDGAISPTKLIESDAVRWHCPRCDHALDSHGRDQAVARAASALGFDPARGGWVPGTWAQDHEGRGTWTAAATFDDAGRITQAQAGTGPHRSYWLSAMYSRFISLGDFHGQGLLADKGREEDRQTYVNGWLNEPYQAKPAAITADTVERVIAVTPGYQLGQTSDPCDHLVLTCDQQGQLSEKSWFPWVLRAWTAAGHSCLIDTGKAVGFAELSILANRTWPIGGQIRRADLIAVDSANGPMQRAIRQWCAQEPDRRLSILGSGTMSMDRAYHRVIGDTPQKRLALCGCPESWVWNQPWFADLLYASMEGLENAMPWHIPGDSPAFYANSLTSEERVDDPGFVKGRRHKWQKRTVTSTSGQVQERQDNHWLDCERMQLVVMTVRNLLRTTPTGETPGDSGPGNTMLNDPFMRSLL